MDERVRFVARLLDGHSMAVVCREFGISRKTGYKIFNRYKDCGVEGLQDRSRKLQRYANQLPFQVERTILRLERKRYNAKGKGLTDPMGYVVPWPRNM